MFNFHFLRNKFKVKKLFSVAEVKLASQANFTGNFETKAQNLGMRLAKRGCCRPGYFLEKFHFTLNALRAV